MFLLDDDSQSTFILDISSAYNKLVEFVIEVTDYVLIPIRKFIPAMIGGVDFSPIIAIFLLNFLKRIIISLLISLA
jgi:YggT family protein